jgi:hypothetical protein
MELSSRTSSVQTVAVSLQHIMCLLYSAVLLYCTVHTTALFFQQLHTVHTTGTLVLIVLALVLVLALAAVVCVVLPTFLLWKSVENNANVNHGMELPENVISSCHTLSGRWHYFSETQHLDACHACMQGP